MDKLLNASPEGQAGFAAYMSGEHAVLSLQVPGVSLSAWFKGHPNWRSSAVFDRLQAVRLRNLPKHSRRSVVSYRHEQKTRAGTASTYLEMPWRCWRIL
jgi:hypothetical protein